MQLVGDPLARQRHQVVGALGAGGESLAVRLAQAEAGVEAEEAKDAQMVLGDPDERVADEADPPLGEVRLAAEIVVNLEAGRIGGQGVDGEVAAGRVLPPVVGIGDVARRPSVATSRRSVVTSTGWPATTAVTVPWARPVGTALIRALPSRAITSSGVSRVARSTSLTGRSSRVSRTQPPT